MPRKTAPPAAPPTSFVEWKARAADELQRRYTVKAGTIPSHVWKRLYVRDLTSTTAADQLATSPYNTRPAFHRNRQRLLPR
jgi:hypothetical protein